MGRIDLGRILQLIFGFVLLVVAGLGVVDMLQVRQEQITMVGLVYLVLLAVGIDIMARAFRE